MKNLIISLERKIPKQTKTFNRIKYPFMKENSESIMYQGIISKYNEATYNKPIDNILNGQQLDFLQNCNHLQII